MHILARSMTIVNRDPPLVYTVDQTLLSFEFRRLWKQLEVDEETLTFVDSSKPSALRDAFAGILR